MPGQDDPAGLPGRENRPAHWSADAQGLQHRAGHNGNVPVVNELDLILISSCCSLGWMLCLLRLMQALVLGEAGARRLRFFSAPGSAEIGQPIATAPSALVAGQAAAHSLSLSLVQNGAIQLSCGDGCMLSTS